MSDASTLKDARAIFQNGGPAAVKAAVAELDPIVIPAERAGGAPEPFPIVRAGVAGGIAEARDFVESLFTEGGASVIYGPSNCGKSFWILDLAVCVATGADFRNELEVDQGAVVYVVLEGEFGVRNRIEALRQAGRLPADAPLFLCYAPVSLLEPGHEARLAETIKLAASESGFPCRLVILDTLARAMAGGDENRGPDMTAAVAAIDAVRAATGAHVAVIHHCGKDEARGARGHSSLRAAVDTEIEVSRAEDETISTVRVTKQRDMAIGDPMPFSLTTLVLGTDRRGNPITSCIVHHEDSMMAADRSKRCRNTDAKHAALLALLPQPSTAEWQRAEAIQNRANAIRIGGPSPEHPRPCNGPLHGGKRGDQWRSCPPLPRPGIPCKGRKGEKC